MASSNPDNYWVTTALMLKVIQLLYLLFNPGLVLVVWTAIPYHSIPVGVWIWKTTKDRNHVASLLVRPSGWKWKEVHPRKLSWNLRIYPWNRKIIFQTILFRFYVILWGCNCLALLLQIMESWMSHVLSTGYCKIMLLWPWCVSKIDTHKLQQQYIIYTHWPDTYSPVGSI